jgi:hypothetical protein
MKPQWKLAALAAAVLAAACGTESSSQQNAQAVSCSMRVAANNDAINAALQQVAAGTLDPCSGALASRELYSAELSRIDAVDGNDAFVEMVFLMRLRHPTDPKVVPF